MIQQRTLHGVYFALAAYLFWGVIPVYFKTLDHVSPWEILCHRVIWSVVLLLLILFWKGDIATLRVRPAVLAKLVLTAVLLTGNWLIYIYAIVNSHIVETSLGYFINPLVSVFLGMIFLSERLRPLQWVAIIIAAAGIGYQLATHAGIPWMALGLAFSFGFYGLIRKNLNLPSVTGLTIETMVILPFALAGLLWLYQTGSMKFGNVDLQTDVLLALGGLVTSFPLLCFAAAVTRLSLTATGMIQYLAPSIALVIAVTAYDEPFGMDRVITFGCIWTALAIFSLESFLHHRRRPFIV